GNDDAFPSGDAPYPGDDAGGRDRLPVHFPGGKLRKLQEWRTGVQQVAHPLTRQQLAAVQVTHACALTPTLLDRGDLGAQVADQRLHSLAIAFEFIAARGQCGADAGHGSDRLSYWI